MTSDDASPTRPHTASSVTELGPHDTGTWVITTRHTRHILDLDRRTYRREPGPDSTPMLHDGRTVALTRIQLYPRVAEVPLFVWFDDPEEPDHFEHWRQSSTVAAITRPPTSGPFSRIS